MPRVLTLTPSLSRSSRGTSSMNRETSSTDRVTRTGSGRCPGVHRRPLRVLLPLLAVLLIGFVLGATPGTAQQRAATSSTAADRPRPVGRWLVDGSGRVRIDHGVNMV